MGTKFTQGTIIEYIHSKKYPTIKCRGLVISARCDFAQEKINYFHCLSALTMEDWIYEVLFFVIIEEMKKGTLGQIKKYCESKELDFETILELDMERAINVLEGSATTKEKNKVMKDIFSWKKYNELSELSVSKEKKKKYFQDEGRKLLKSKIQQLYNGNFPKFGFIPQKAFINSKSLVEGLVVDLQDITQIDIRHKKCIISYEYDYKILQDCKRRKEINEIFFFENDDDFVMADSIVESPWIEYILQLFANSFIRIGLDNAVDYEIEEYCNKIVEEHI